MSFASLARTLQKPILRKTSHDHGVQSRDKDESTLPMDSDHANYPFKYDSNTPRLRLYITPERRDLPFDHPKQPLCLDLPEKLACKHSELIRQALQYKRNPKRKFDVQDEMIWEPATSITSRKFPAPYVVVNMEEVILNLCDPLEPVWLTERRKGPYMLEWAGKVKHLMLANIGELWDAMKTWMAYIEREDLVLFNDNRARENALDVAILLGALPTFLEMLTKKGGVSLAGRAVNLEPQSGCYAPPKKSSGQVLEKPKPDREDKLFERDLERKRAERPLPPQWPLSNVRETARVDFTGTSTIRGIYKNEFGLEGGPLMITRSNDTNQIIDGDNQLPRTSNMKHRNVSPGPVSANSGFKRVPGGKSSTKATTRKAQMSEAFNATSSKTGKTRQTRDRTESKSESFLDAVSDPVDVSSGRDGWVRRSQRRGAGQSYQHVFGDDDDESIDGIEDQYDVDYVDDCYVESSKPNNSVRNRSSRELSTLPHPAVSVRPSTPKIQLGDPEDSLDDALSKLVKSRPIKKTTRVIHHASVAVSNDIHPKRTAGATKDDNHSLLGRSSRKGDESVAASRVPSENSEQQGTSAPGHLIAGRSNGSNGITRQDAPSTAPVRITRSAKATRKIAGKRFTNVAGADNLVLFFLESEKSNLPLDHIDQTRHHRVPHQLISIHSSAIKRLLRTKQGPDGFDKQDLLCWMPGVSSTEKPFSNWAVYIMPFLSSLAGSGNKHAAELSACDSLDIWSLFSHWFCWVASFEDGASLALISSAEEKEKLIKFAKVIGASKVYINALEKFEVLG